VLRAGLFGAAVPASRVERILAKFKLRDVRTSLLLCQAIISSGMFSPKGEESGKRKGKDEGETLTLGDVYQNAFAIGLKPREVDMLTIWEYAQCVKGFAIAHGVEDEIEAPDQDEIASMFAKYG
jgi:hypothetical protein